MKKQLLALLLAVALTASLAGCGFTGSSKSSPDAASSAAKSETASTSTGETTEERRLVVYDPNEYRTLVQWAASDNNCFAVLNNVSEGLYRLDENHEPQPALATGYEMSEDGLTYTFTLRDGLTWSNGTPLTAKDFVYAWLKQMSADATNGYSFIMTDYIVKGAEYLEDKATAEEVGVKALDDKTLEVKLIAPTPYFVRLTVMPMFFPLNEEFVNQQADNYGLKAENMIYCGPYVIESYDPASGSVLKKNASYWDASNVKIEDVQMRIIKDASAALNAYDAGELSRVILTSADVPARRDDPEFGSLSEFRTTYLQYNTTDPALKNLNIRKALGYAIDRSTLAEAILADGSAPATGLVAAGMFGDGEKTFRELSGDLSPMDAAKAKEFWDKGVEELGSTPTITLLVADDSLTKTVATYVQSQFKTVLGIDAVIDSKTVKARNELMDNNNYQLAITGWGADYDDAMTYLDLWTNGTPYRGNYNNEAYNKLITDARFSTDAQARLNMLLEAEKTLVEQDAVVSPLYYRGQAFLTKSYVKNLVAHPFGPPIEFKYAYFEG